MMVLSTTDSYRQALEQAFEGLPCGPPPRRKHTGGWDTAQREAWNLATRMRRHQEQVLRLLVDTRIPAGNNEAERSVRTCKLHDKISGCFRSSTDAEAFLTVRSYLQTGAEHGQTPWIYLLASGRLMEPGYPAWPFGRVAE